MMKNYGAAYNPPSIQLGEVLSDDPLTVKIGDLQLNSNNLLVSDFLLKDYTRQASQEELACDGYDDINSRFPKTCPANNNAPCDTNPGGKSGLTSTSTLKLTDGLNKGDIVAMMPTYDGQKFIVLTRVVTV